MPNWCTNEWIIRGNAPQVKQLFDLLTNDTHTAITFQKLIPMPALLQRVASGYQVIDGVGVSHCIEDVTPDGQPHWRLPTPQETLALQNIGFTCPIEWALVHWGTKWDASHPTVEPPYEASNGTLTLNLTFLTPWCPPTPVSDYLETTYPELAFSFDDFEVRSTERALA